MSELSKRLFELRQRRVTQYARLSNEKLEVHRQILQSEANLISDEQEFRRLEAIYAAAEFALVPEEHS